MMRINFVPFYEIDIYMERHDRANYMISRYHSQIDLYYRYHDIVSMNQELEMTDVSLILKRNGFEKVAESKDHIVKFVQSMTGGEHVIFLWENEETRIK